MRLSTLTVLLLFVLALHGPRACAEEPVVRVGADAAAAPVAELLLKTFRAANRRDTLRLEKNAATFSDLSRGRIDFFLAGRFIDEHSYENLVANRRVPTGHLLGYRAVRVLVHADNPVESITADQLRYLFLGVVDNWKELGGNSTTIVPLLPANGSALRSIVTGQVLEGLRPHANAQPIDPKWTIGKILPSVTGAIGFCFGPEPAGCKTLKIDGQSPSPVAVASGRYPLSIPVYLYSGNSFDPFGPYRRFVDHCRSAFTASDAKDNCATCGLVPTLARRNVPAATDAIPVAASPELEPTVAALLKAFPNEETPPRMIRKPSWPQLLENPRTVLALASPLTYAEYRAAVAFGAEPVGHVVARDALALVVHPGNPLKNLSEQDAEAIYAGEIDNWSELGGPDKPIAVVVRVTSGDSWNPLEQLALQRAEIYKHILYVNSEDEVKQAVAKDAYAIGPLRLDRIDASVRALTLDNVPLTPATAASGAYPLIRQVILYTNGYPNRQSLLERLVRFPQTLSGESVMKKSGWMATP